MNLINDTMCNLLEVPLYFTDFWQGAVLKGRHRLDGRVTFRESTEYYARKLGETGRRRDVLMKHKGTVSCLMAVEIMSTIDYTIPARIMDYNSRENKRQLNEKAIENRKEENLGEIQWDHGGEFLYGVKRHDRILPIKTVGLYCGMGEYDGTSDVFDLYDMSNIQKQCADMYNHYPVEILNMSQMDENLFETGLRELVGVFKRSHSRKELKKYYLENEERFRKLDDYIIDAMGALIGMSKLKEFRQENGGVDMCKAFEEEREEGRLEGKEQTLVDNLKSIINKLGYSVEQALQLLMVPEDEWGKYRNLV